MISPLTAPGDVSEATLARLRVLVTVHGWTPMLSTDPDSGLYRAWIRHTDGRRIFGAHRDTAEASALTLIAKCERYTVPR